MCARDFLTTCKFFCALSFLLAIAFAIAKDGWHTGLFTAGGILWIIAVAIWTAVAEQEDESSKR